MEKQPINKNEKMSKILFWLDTWFQKSDELPDFNNQELMIYNEIKDKWMKKDRIILLNSLKEKYGEKVHSVLEKVIKKNIIKDWQEMAQKKGNNSLESLIEVLWAPLKTAGFEYTKEVTSKGIQFKCTKCPIYDLAKEINATEWIYTLVCFGDFHLIKGFNPKISLKRDKTLIEGNDYCNHFYSIDEN